MSISSGVLSCSYVKDVPQLPQKVRHASVSVLYLVGAPSSNCKSERFTLTQAIACVPTARRQFSQWQFDWLYGAAFVLKRTAPQ